MAETPKKAAVQKDGNFEVGNYPACIEAEVFITGRSSQAAIYDGFNHLVGQIFGNNIKAEKISMTKPDTAFMSIHYACLVVWEHASLVMFTTMMQSV